MEALPEEVEMEEDEADSEGSFLYYIVLLVFLHKNNIKVKFTRVAGKGKISLIQGKLVRSRSSSVDRNETRIKEND